MTPNEVICRAFLTTLKGAAKVWFNKIPPGTIVDIKQLSKSFVCHFIGGQKHKKPTSHLLNIQQAEGELLRQYVTRFNKELLQVDKAEDQVILKTFQAGLLPWDFFFSITKSPPKTVRRVAMKSSEIHECKREMKEQATIATRRKRRGVLGRP